MRANRATTQQQWLACIGACLCAVTLAFACLPLAPAYAEDDDNVVDEQQLPDSSFVYDTSIMALAGANSSFDNQTVQVVGEVKKYFKSQVYGTVIPRNVRLSEAPSHGLPIHLYDARCQGALAYTALAQEVIRRREGN